MKKPLLALNAAALLLILGYAALALVNAGGVARQPWASTCYSCKACAATCVLGIDPQGFVSAALAGSGDAQVYATNVRLSAKKALELDPGMTVSVDGRHLSAREAAARLGPDAELVSFRMKARHAAQLCLRCGACERSCVLQLPLLRMVNQLRGPEAPAGAKEAGRAP